MLVSGGLIFGEVLYSRGPYIRGGLCMGFYSNWFVDTKVYNDIKYNKVISANYFVKETKGIS